MDCPEKHTTYQPNKQEFQCPRCGTTPEGHRNGVPTGSDGFVIDCLAAKAADDCILLHVADELFCNGCGYSTTGKAFATRCAKGVHTRTCPTCKGKGLVQTK